MAKRFRFGADILLKLRKRREEAARRRLVQGASEIEAICERVDKLHAAQRTHKEALSKMLSDGADAMNIRLYGQCIHDIDQSITEQSGRLDSARGDLEANRETLVEAVGRRRAMSTLKQRQQIADAAQRRLDETRENEELHAARLVGQAAFDRETMHSTAGNES